MTKFEEYLSNLADHEEESSLAKLDPRSKILVNAGVRLNWMGDFIANPKIKYKKKRIPINKILFTGTTREWNSVLLDQCSGNIERFKELVENNVAIKKKFFKEASFSEEPILLRGPDKNGLYRTFDGMHRFVGAVLAGKKTIAAYVPLNEGAQLPICEPHVVYDLIRGFQRHAKDEQGKKELLHALNLLARTYENVTDLLEKRFDQAHLPDKEVQAVINAVIKKNKLPGIMHNTRTKKSHKILK
ncbi:hypothetical protein HGA64_05375 [Candidatus Falkowbacteria bacterium]|nr:hypothetical protein [Candidatus Falkowbacteria bacterium]